MKLKPNLKEGGIGSFFNHKLIVKNMESENLSDLSVTELLKKEKDSKEVLKYSTAVLIVAPIVMIGLFVQKQYGNVLFTTVMCILLPIFLIFYSKKQLSDIKIEIEKRNNNQ
jgi:undecaprenyl pyrophosphate phosphatase UppP